MKQTVNYYDFERAFKALRPDNFSYDGLHALFEYFEDLEEDCGTEMELDVVAICCDYAEYTEQELWDEYGHKFDNLDEYESKEDALEDFIDKLRDYTAVIETEGDTYIVVAF